MLSKKDQMIVDTYAELRDVEKQLKDLKAVYRDPKMQPPQLVTYVDLAKNKKRATKIYATIAHSRGRVHIQGWSLDKQAEFLGLDKEPEKKGILARLFA